MKHIKLYEKIENLSLRIKNHENTFQYFHAII